MEFDIDKLSGEFEQALAHARMVAGVSAWLDLGRPSAIPMGDTSSHSLLRAVGHLTGLAGMSVDPRRSRRLLLKAEADPRYKSLAMNLRLQAEGIPSANIDDVLGWLRKAQERNVAAAREGCVYALAKIVAAAVPGGQKSDFWVDPEPLLAQHPDIAPEALTWGGVMRSRYDKKSSEELFMRAIRSGSISAYWDIAKILREAGRGDEAMAMMDEGAQRGNPFCCGFLATRMWLSGENPDLAIRYGYVAAHHGVLDGFASYGLLLHKHQPEHPDCFNALLVRSLFEETLYQSVYAMELLEVLEAKMPKGGDPTAGRRAYDWYADQIDETRDLEGMALFGQIWTQYAFGEKSMFTPRPPKIA